MLIYTIPFNAIFIGGIMLVLGVDWLTNLLKKDGLPTAEKAFHSATFQMTDGVLIARYVYDPFGRRIWKDVRGVKTFYHYSDSGLVAEMDASGNVRKSYGYRPDSPWGTLSGISTTSVVSV